MCTRYFNALGLSLILSLATIIVFTLSMTSTHAAIFIAKADVAEAVDSNETGIAHYPGAIRVTTNECIETIASDTHSANSLNRTCKRKFNANVKIDFAIGAYGLKFIVAKWQSGDSATDIAAFYQRELARFGNVLDSVMPQQSRNSNGPTMTITRLLAIAVQPVRR